MVTHPSSSVYLPALTPSPTFGSEDNPSSMEVIPSFVLPDENTNVTVYFGSYIESNLDPMSETILTAWNEPYYSLPIKESAFIMNGVIMGDIGTFANALDLMVEKLSSTTFRLNISKTAELIFTKDSDIAVFNGENIKLETTTYYKGLLYIPLSNVAELIDLHTYQRYSKLHNHYYLWLSECAVLDEREFEPNENYQAPTLINWADENGGNQSSNVYKLNEDGNTYSGVKIGHSREDVIEILGAPEYQETYTTKQDYYPGDSRIMYFCNPQQMNDLSDFIDIYFVNGFVSEIRLNIYNWED